MKLTVILLALALLTACDHRPQPHRRLLARCFTGGDIFIDDRGGWWAGATPVAPGAKLRDICK